MTAATGLAGRDKPSVGPWMRHRFGDVWLVRTDAASRAPLSAHLSFGFPDTLVQRAARLHDGEQRAQYLYAHKLLHEMLGRHVGWPVHGARPLRQAQDRPSEATDSPLGAQRAWGPVHGARSPEADDGSVGAQRASGLDWNVSALGKPDCGLRGPAFSLSRRGAWAAFVLGGAATPLLGIDLEIAHDIDAPLDLARDHFTPRELGALRGEPASERAYAFLRAWTRKEAVMKAVGLGVSLPARSFHVGLGRDAVSLRVAHDGRSWDVELESLPDEGDTIVALARAVPVAVD